MKTLYKQYFMILSLSVILGCAGSREAGSEPAEQPVSRRSDCISKGSIRDYKILDEQNLIVTEGVSRKYHVELSRRAFGLKSSFAIGFQSRSERVCGGFDSLVYDDSLRADSIRIASIRRLTPEQEDNLLVRFGLREPELQEPRQPEAVEGAEVEELD